MSEIQPRLQYNYCKINPDTGECLVCMTCSYTIPLPEYILVPEHTNDYVGKFYNTSTGLWYIDSGFQTVWADAPTWD